MRTTRVGSLSASHMQTSRTDAPFAWKKLCASITPLLRSQICCRVGKQSGSVLADRGPVNADNDDAIRNGATLLGPAVATGRSSLEKCFAPPLITLRRLLVASRVCNLSGWGGKSFQLPGSPLERSQECTQLLHFR